MRTFANSPLAVVEVEGTAALLIIAVFFFTFVLVCLIAWWLVSRAKPGPGGTTTWQLDATARLPVSKAGFDRLADVTAAAVAPRQPAPGAEAFFERVDAVRDTALGAYRIVMIGIGLLGVAISVRWFWDATPANMLGLPAGILLLLSLGALLEGSSPRRSRRKSEPIEPHLLDKIHVNVAKGSLTVRLGEFEMLQAAELLTRGTPPAEVARAIYPDYDTRDAGEKAAVADAIVQAVHQHRRTSR